MVIHTYAQVRQNIEWNVSDHCTFVYRTNGYFMGRIYFLPGKKTHLFSKMLNIASEKRIASNVVLGLDRVLRIRPVSIMDFGVYTTVMNDRVFPNGSYGPGVVLIIKKSERIDKTFEGDKSTMKLDLVESNLFNVQENHGLQRSLSTKEELRFS
uniref:PUA domain-containing protein n=1 Tax=Rhabditophanes sp. KR3021 TaxID=114890 RepID=A0AC35TQ99_9BILA